MRRIVRPAKPLEPNKAMVECLYCQQVKFLTLQALEAAPIQYWCDNFCKKRYVNHGPRKYRRIKEPKRSLSERGPKFNHKDFYRTREWCQLRYQVIMHYGNQCMCCGGSPPKVMIHVDHIKPISHFPDLRLEFNNLQILCAACNVGKSNIEQTDFRPKVSNGRLNKLL